MELLTEDQKKVLTDAYDDNFIDLPNTDLVGDLEGYTHMQEERITTNNDARDLVLGEGGQKFDIKTQNMIIDKTPSTEIVEAVRKANGYGRRYIEWLEREGKLTSEKIQQFREAMKKVGSVLLPVSITTKSISEKNK